MDDLSELERLSSKGLRLRLGRGGERRVVVPRRIGAATFALVLALVWNAAVAIVVVGALGPGGSGIEGEHILWVAGSSVFGLALLAATLMATFGRKAILWDASGIRVQDRCLGFHIDRHRVAWGDIQDLGIFRVYRRSGSVVSLPSGRLWSEAEGEALKALLRERWIQNRPKDADIALEVVAIPQVPERSRGIAVGLFLGIAIVGLFFTYIFSMAGLWNDWLALLGLVPRARALNLVLLVIPPIFPIGFVVLPLFLVRAALRPDTKRDPQAFFFDNRIGRMAISNSTRIAHESPAESASLPGYDYAEIDGFGYHNYVVHRGSSSATGNSHSHLSYVVEARMANGAVWLLEELAYESEARARVAELTRIVKLRESSCPPERRRRSEVPAAVMARNSGSADFFVWRDRSSFGASTGFLLSSLAFAALGSFFNGRAFVPGFVFFVAFAAIMGILGISLLVSSLRKRQKAFALRLDAVELQTGTLPMSLMKGGASFERLDAAFKPDRTWALGSISGIATVFTEETRNQKVHYIKIIRGNEEEPRGSPSRDKKAFLSIADLSLGEAVDFEQIITRGLRERISHTN